MEHTDKRILTTCSGMALIAVTAVLVLGGAAYWLLRQMTPSVKVEERTEVYMTATQIASISRIGQWEMLTIDDEEMVDTVRKGFLTDDHLVRIYYGTLRLGIDFSRVDSTCFSARGDTLMVMLPDAGLLDDNFIDEARTRAFYERGQWTGADRKALYERARQKMLARCMTPENLEATRRQAEAQTRQLLRAMGVAQTVIAFGQRPR